MVGVEIDLIQEDTLAALTLYEKIFEVERIEVTALPKGNNEAVFTIYGVRFHMLDENAELGMVAPKEGDPKPIWFNVLVPDIKATYEKAMWAGCTEVQPLMDMMEGSVTNAMFTDPYGYMWMLHQIHREVSFEDRLKMYENMADKEDQAQ